VSAYTLEALLGAARIAFWGAMVLVVVPGLVLRPLRRSTGSAHAGRLDRLVEGVFLAVVLGHVLTVLGAFDLFALLGAYLALAAVLTQVSGGPGPRAALRAAWRRLVIGALDALDRRGGIAWWARELPAPATPGTFALPPVPSSPGPGTSPVIIPIIAGASGAVTAGVPAAGAGVSSGHGVTTPDPNTPAGPSPDEDTTGFPRVPAALGRRALAARPRGVEAGWLLLGVAVLAVSAWLRLRDALLHPAATQADHFLHLDWLRELLADEQLWPDGFYPQGSTALIGVLQRFTALDETLLVRLMPGMAACGLVVTVAWAVRRLTGSAAATVIAVALYGMGAFGGLLPFPWPLSEDVLAVEVALVALLPALVLATEAAAGRPGARRSAFLAVLVAGLVHPVVGALTLGGVVIVSVVYAVRPYVRSRTPAQVLAVALGAGVVAAIPLGLALVAGQPPPERLVDDGFIAPRGFPVPAMDVPLGALPGLALASLLVLVAPPWGREATAGPRALSLVCLAALALVAPSRLGLPEVVDPPQAGRAASLVGALVAGLLVHRLASGVRWVLARAGRWTPAPRQGALAGLAVTALLAGGVAAAGARDVRAGRRLQPDAVVAALHAIKRDFPDRTWTVVEEPATIVQVATRGFYFPAQTFPDAYPPPRWRFDPRRPELSLPTRHVFIFVRSGGPVAGAPRAGTAARLRAWVQEYRRLHEDMTVYRRAPGLTVFHIERSLEVERRVLDRVARERLEESRREERTR
jgi:hypothetical protein